MGREGRRGKRERGKGRKERGERGKGRKERGEREGEDDGGREGNGRGSVKTDV